MRAAPRTLWQLPDAQRLRTVDEIVHPRSILRQWDLFIALTVVGLALGVAFIEIRPKVYTSEVRMLIDSMHDNQQMAQLERQSIGLRGDLELIAQSEAKLRIRRARLLAERAGERDFEVPASLSDRADDPELRRLYADELAILRSELNLNQSRKERLEEQITSATTEIEGVGRQIEAKQEQLEILSQEDERLQSLVDRELTPITRLLQVRRDAAEVNAQISDLDRQRTRARSTVARSRIDLEALELESASKAAGSLAQVERDLDEITSRSGTVARQLDRQASPLAGEPLNPLFIQNQVELLNSDLVVDQAFTVYLASTQTEMPADPVERQRQYEEFRKELTTRGIARSSVLYASFGANDPGVAVDVVRAVTDAYTAAFTALGAGNAIEGVSGSDAIVRIITGPTVPVDAEGPGDVAIFAGSAIFALMLASLGAVARELFETRIRTRLDVERAFGVPSLGIVPRSTRAMGKSRMPSGQGIGKTLFGGRSRSADSRAASIGVLTMRRVLASVMGSNLTSGQVLGVSSARAQEGKTSLSWGLADVAVEAGWRVMLIDAGVLDPKLRPYGDFHKLVDGSASLAEGTELVSGTHVVSVPRDSTGQPLGTVYGRAFGGFLDAARQSYDLIIFDLTSLAPQADVQRVADWLDALVLVIEWKQTRAEAIRYALASSGGSPRLPLTGAVLNKVDLGKYRAMNDPGEILAER
ncbi:MAG: hypothetical protein AAF580_04840 [Pseudomonadota bacterium]